MKIVKPLYICRFHPTDSFHQIGCEHQYWTLDDLEKAYRNCKPDNNPILKDLRRQILLRKAIDRQGDDEKRTRV